MLPPDRGTRNLLPLLIEKQDEIGQAAEDGGEVRQISDTGLSTSPSANPSIEPAVPHVGPIHQDTGSSPQGSTAPAAQNPAAQASSSSIDLNRSDAIGGGHSAMKVGDSGSGTSSAHGSPSGGPMGRDISPTASRLSRRMAV